MWRGRDPWRTAHGGLRIVGCAFDGTSLCDLFLIREYKGGGGGVVTLRCPRI